MSDNPYGWIESGKVVYITPEAYQAILRQARIDAPVESCGYAMGETSEDGRPFITMNYPMKNIDHSEEHFTMDPRQQFAAVKYARKNGFKVIGNWHSHPASPSRPSEEDKRLAADPGIFYLILSLAGEEPVLNAFEIKDGKVTRYAVEKKVKRTTDEKTDDSDKH